MTGIVSTVLILIFASWLVFRYDDVIRNLFSSRISGVELFGVKFTVAEQSLQKLAKPISTDLSSSGAERIPLSSDDREQIIKRAKLIAQIFQHGRVLWVDDHPEWILLEVNFLQALGVSVDNVANNQSAYALIEAQNENQTPYDVVISDIGRDREPGESGFTLLQGLRERGVDTTLIFFTGDEVEIPPEAFAVTTYSGDLLNYVFDVLERTSLCRCKEQIESPAGESRKANPQEP